MRRVFPLLSLAILLLVFGCTKEHDELLEDFPLPVVTQAQLVETSPGEWVVNVAWTDPNAAYVDSYRVHLGATVVSGSQILDADSLVATVAGMEYTWEDMPLWMTVENDSFCINNGLCDSVFKYHNFRVNSVTSGIDGEKGPFLFIYR